MSTAPLTIQLFGPLRVLVQGEPIPRVPTRSVEWLLALLVLRQARAVDRSWLAGTLWPDSTESQALHNLRDVLVHLRKALGPERGRLQSPTRDTLAFDITGAEIDTLRFDAAMQAGDEEALRSAAALYTGPLLEGCFEEWVVLERNQRQQACLRVLETLANAAEQRQDYVQALEWLRRAEGMNAFSDSIRRGLMRVLAASGDAPAALSCYRDYRVFLREEMNAETDAATVELYQQIRQQARQAAQHREAIRQEAFPSPAFSPRTPSPPAALPHPLTALIGRDQEVQEIAASFANSRLITLVGGGGVGKTRLAIEVARKLSSHFAEGAVFVALASLADAALLPAFVAAALGIREQATPEPTFFLQALTGWLCTHEVLLVLDNCEHLVEAAAELTQTLLERCPQLHILATSRQRLGLTGEITWRVPSLLAPDPQEFRLPQGSKPLPPSTSNLQHQVMQYPAVQLFVERAAMARPGFRLTDSGEALAVARICRQLDGIPLALELAAARVGILSVVQIASRLSDRFRLLTAVSRAALPRQQTLKSLIDWSYDLLTEEEQALLCRLAVFAGGWTLEAAEQVCAEQPHDVLDLVASLVDKSLVVMEEGEAECRYRMLETVREYARDRLRDTGEETLWRDRHLGYFQARAEEAEPHLLGTHQEVGLEQIETEHDNLRAALAWAQARAATSQDYLRLSTALWPFWELRGHLTEGRAHLNTALRWSVGSVSPLRARALLGAARLAVLQSDANEALTYGQEALEQFQRPEDGRGRAEALLYLAEACWKCHDVARAVPLVTQALDNSRKSRWQAGTILATLRLAMAYVEQHDRKQGRSLLEEALALAKDHGDLRMVAMVYQVLGNLEIKEGHYPQARAVLEETLSMQRRLRDRIGIAGALGELGELEQFEDRARAIAYRREQLAIYRELGDPVEIAYTLHQIAVLHYQQGDYETARQAFAEALDLVLSLQSEAGFDYMRMNLGSTLFHLGEPARALELHREALARFGKTSNAEGIVWALERIGIVEAWYGDVQKAAHLLGAASPMREELGIPMSLLDQKDWDEALATVCATLHKTSFASLRKEGRAMTKEQAIALALEK